MPFPTAHALLIGIGTYAHAPQLDVPITAADANAVALVLRDPQYCGYLPEQVTLLSDAAASREGILAALDGLAARAGEGDTVFIFYAGHGEYGDDGYYLTTHDTQLAGRKVAVGTGIREAELIAKLRTIKAKRLVLIVNACHSGEISPILAPSEEPITGTPLPPQISAALLGTGEGRVIISACRESQYSFVGPGPLTLFTQALVDGLQGKGVSSNRGYISVFDLYTHLYFALDEAVPRQVSAAVRQRYGEKQEPELTILKGVGPFAVALYRGATILGEFDTSGGPSEDTVVREVNPAYAQSMLRQHQQIIGGNAQVGVAVAGDVHGNVTNIGGNVSGPVFSGSFSGPIEVGGDRITVGDISGTGIAIGHGAQSTVRTVNTGGGDYAEGSIDKRQGTFVGEGSSKDQKTPSASDPNLQRRQFEAAMPEVARVNRPTEVRVMIALEHSVGLRALLPDFTESGELIRREDVESRNVRLLFPSGKATIDVSITLEALDFIIPEHNIKLQVPIDEDSGVATFALTPRQENEYGRVVVRLYGNGTLINTLTLQVAIKPESFNLRKIVWKLFTGGFSLGLSQASLATAGPQSVVFLTENRMIHTTTYAEGNVDERRGAFVSGDQFNMSGNFSGAILNIKSTLTNVSQSIGAAPIGDAATKAQLQALVEQLSAELQKVPAEKASYAEAVAETAKAAVDQATKAQPNKTLVQISAEGLKQASQNLAAVLPTVLPIATQIADVLRKMIGA